MNHVIADEQRTKRTGPERTCVGCRAHESRDELLRFAFEGGRLVSDPRARLGGRGVWVHGRRACVVRAVRGGGFAKVLRAKVDLAAADVVSQLRADAEASVLASLASARRARHAVHEADECLALLASGAGHLAVIATDERASKESVREDARRAGVPVLEYGDRAALGRVFGKKETGTVIVTDQGLASSISRAASRIAALSEGE